MPTVGEILSAERRRQGKQLSDVVEGTKIRSRLIDALEQGRYDDLPSPAYVKGYIQSYARYLEIPAEPLLEQFRSESRDTVRRVSPIDRYLAAIPADTVVPRRDRAHEIPRNVWIAVVVGVVVVMLLLCVIAGWLVPALTGLPPSSTSTPASAGATASVDATNTTTESLGFTLRISVRTGLASSVKVTIDGHVDFNGSMQDGASKEYLVKDTAVLVIGNPDAVVVTRDGATVAVTAGEPLTLTATN
ncbi:MAG TPA: RodZ domain-containing protein [Coriobacteriia bacterium]